MENKPGKTDRLDKIVAETRRQSEERGHAYRDKALRLFPWICGRCGREFNRKNLHELTVHHRDHNHDNNPEDGSNWELLCLYCHDNEHSRYVNSQDNPQILSPGRGNPVATHKPFADLKSLIKGNKS